MNATMEGQTLETTGTEEETETIMIMKETEIIETKRGTKIGKENDIKEEEEGTIIVLILPHNLFIFTQTLLELTEIDI
jgi:hypothetical protein